MLLREARNPTATYGSRVKRRIRGRWFSLVPIRRRTLVLVAAVMWGSVLCLCIAHHAAVTWPSLAANWDVARPLRLDEPTSFGRWIMTLLLAAGAGVSLLIYQLRRYRIDDFQGHYRVWRLVIIFCAIASLDSLVSVVDWSGAILDFAIGRRAALSGNDWMRILVALGGTVLAMRLVAEVRRSRWSLVTMLIGWSLLAIPVAAKWNFFEVNSLTRWTLVTTAPLLAITTLFLSLVGYLRLLYREVRQVEDADSMILRFQNFRERMFPREAADAEEPAAQVAVNSDAQQQGRWLGGWFSRREKSPAEAEPAGPTRAERRTAEREKRAFEKAERDAKIAAERADKAAAVEAAKQAKPSKAAASSGADTSTGDSTPPRRGWFRQRAAAIAVAAGTEEMPAPTAKRETESEAASAEPAKRAGLGGWFGKRKATEGDDALVTEILTTAPSASRGGGSPHHDDPESEGDGDDDADYSGMSKAERRRMRKLQRRGGNAA